MDSQERERQNNEYLVYKQKLKKFDYNNLYSWNAKNR